MSGHGIRFLVSYHDHQAFAAVTAGGAIYFRRNGCIQAGDERIYQFCSLLFQERGEPVIFRLSGIGEYSYPREIGFDISCSRTDAAKLGFASVKQLFNMVIHI